MIKQNFEVTPLLSDWLLTYTNQGRSPGTVRTYRALVSGMVRWWETRHDRTMHCRDLGDGDNGRLMVEQYVTYCRGAGWAATSMKTLLAALRQFTGWLHASGYTAAHTANAAKGPRLPKRQIEILSDTEIATVEHYIQSTAESYDGLLLFRLLLGTGLRRAEAASLLVRDASLIDGRGQPLKHGTLTVIGKGDKQRTVGTGLWLTSELRRYVKEVRPKRVNRDEPAAELLLNQWGNPMAAETVTRRFHRWSVALEMPKLHPHTCRHTFATNFICAGGDISELMILLGHTSIQQTMGYVQLAGQQHVIERAQALCPIDARLATRKINRQLGKTNDELTGFSPTLRSLPPRFRAQSKRA